VKLNPNTSPLFCSAGFTGGLLLNLSSTAFLTAFWKAFSTASIEALQVIYKKELIEDGLGGYTTKDVGIKSIKCKVAPFTISEIDSAGRLATYSKNKLFTQEKLDKLLDLDEDFYILYGNKSL